MASVAKHCGLDDDHAGKDEADQSVGGWYADDFPPDSEPVFDTGARNGQSKPSADKPSKVFTRPGAGGSKPKTVKQAELQADE